MTAGGRFRATAVTIMKDGVAETFTAAALSPFIDPCGNRDLGSGEIFFAPGVLTGYVAAFAAAADFALLGRDPFDWPVEEIALAGATATWVGGRRVA